MKFYDKNLSQIVSFLGSDKNLGLNKNSQSKNVQKFGRNILTKQKKLTFFNRLLNAVKEPMLIILLFGFAIAFGSAFGKFLKTGENDFMECFGILFAVVISVSITLIMEGTSERAFEVLNSMYRNVAVRVVRDGKTILISEQDLIVGDIVVVENGDKVVADGRLIECTDLTVDESALTGESMQVKKSAIDILPQEYPLAERKNCLFSGTFITGGSGKMIITALGNNTEMGNIAGELLTKEIKESPLQEKLSRLGKTITIIGASSAVLVFIISIIRLSLFGVLDFRNIQELFISCIVLIVAAVPEGLPTIVAISLALNMIKLAKSNALIKKMTATETAGAVSVICSDKTGTLTQNKMQVISICMSNLCAMPEKIKSEVIRQNFVLNSTADITISNQKTINIGSATECALLEAYNKMEKVVSYQEYRKQFSIIDRQEFTSQSKIMTTTINLGANKKRILLKGAPEKVLPMCTLSYAQSQKILNQMKVHQQNARRVLCFAHMDSFINTSKYVYDGFVAIADPIRKDVYKSVLDCKKSGIDIKILTGDNKITAFAIAKELKLISDIGQVVESDDIEKLDDYSLKKILPKISVIARSTPATKLRVVKALKELGEVVAVTGDGINDAPAIKHADVGIAMGKSGSDITKESADIVLLDDSFSTVVKTIAFGRNVYKNLQRFILFQLSVNLSALLFITVCAIMNLPSPFNTLQLLWINIIMDGPPALTLGLESASERVMRQPPVKRNESIVGFSMFMRILFNGLYIGVIMLMQYNYNFLQLDFSELASGTFSLFIFLQLFNAFNSRELGAESILKSIGKNKIMLITFAFAFTLHLIIVQVLYDLFFIKPLSLLSWLKIIITAFSIILVCESGKLLYRLFRKEKQQKLTIK